MADTHKKFIETHVIPEILTKLPNEEFISFEAEHSAGLDGFMSTLYNIELTTKTSKGPKEHLLIAKFMKGDDQFRESSKSYIQYANEIYIYAKVLPAYENLLKEYKITDIKVSNWVPDCFKAEFGYIEGLSSSPGEKEAALVLQNLKPLGYQLGPRLTLNLDHLKAMCKLIAQYHAFSFALSALNETQMERLKSGIITLPFVNDSDPNDNTKNMWRIFYRLAFNRFFDFIDRKIDTITFDKKSPKDLRLIECCRNLKEKYFSEPVRLLERLRTKVEENEEDRRFAAILHGDYTRNNVLFKYKNLEECDNGGGTCEDDRFSGTILNASERSAEEIKDILQHYTFEKFQAHFSRFAFYGAMKCLHFLSWMLCSEDECARLSELFATDMYGEEYRKLSIEAGGDEVNMQLLDLMRHASDMGYMDDL